MKVKICGLNPTRDVQTCIDLNVNFLGFVFYNKSPRNTDLKDITILKKYNPKSSIYVSVCVNPTDIFIQKNICLLYTSPSPRDAHESRMPSSA